MRGATIRDVARAADVSVATVSRTLNGLATVAVPTRDRVLRVAGELDYVPHSGARALSTRRTDTIGVLLPDLHGEFFSELIRGIDLSARARGLHLLLSSSHGDPAEAAAALRAMRSRVDSVIVMMPSASEEHAVHAARGAGPMIFLGDNGGSGDHPSFVIDNYGGAFAITEHLAQAGRRRIVFVTGPAANSEARERQRGYRSAIRTAELPEIIVAGDFTEQAGRAAAQRLLADGLPDAVFCANDMMAIGCLEALREAGIAVPSDIALAGFDDIPIARYVSPPLTTAAVPIAEIGRRALDCCVDAIAGREPGGRRLFKPKLVIRASSVMPTQTTSIKRGHEHG
ncbi:LacI family DNA-binding transcriptional regulator [Sphingomonas sp.]|uniref:LacI family DNA-binding transcriptional regulator n=1 Tax=Sphingomonas sp. TaxID=28214 RepID=UPI00286E3CE2|nr:LacI family DNA-binding transcriptional regulator [Sphingomonas sp.]